MSIHPNSNGSQTDGVKVEPWSKFVSHQLALSVAAVAQLTEPAGCNQAVAQAGFLIPAGQTITLSAADALTRDGTIGR